jgi:hypothetical protein
MRLEFLIQFIVPLAFLAIWALTSLLNRDAQPLPPRPGRPQGPPGGPRPANRPQPLPAADPRLRQGGGAAPAERTLSRVMDDGPARTPSRAKPRPRPGTNLDDSIVYLENEDAAWSGSRSPGSSLLNDPQGSRGGRGSPQRRGTRGRSGGGLNAPAPARSEPETQRALSDMVNQSLARQRTRPLEITPLGALITPLSRSLSHVSSAPERVHERVDAPPTLNAADIRAQITSPTRLREMILLNEILKPPVALRGRRPRP